jgi:hypothetical protein
MLHWHWTVHDLDGAADHEVVLAAGELTK